MQTPKQRPLWLNSHRTVPPRLRNSAANPLFMTTLLVTFFIIISLQRELSNPLIPDDLWIGGWGAQPARFPILGAIRLKKATTVTMDRLYYDNPSLLEFDATVTGVEDRGEQALVSLDQTAF